MLRYLQLNKPIMYFLCHHTRKQPTAYMLLNSSAKSLLEQKPEQKAPLDAQEAVSYF